MTATARTTAILGPEIGDEAPPLRILRRDVRAMLDDLGPDQVRSVVDYYYAAQQRRIAAAGQVRALTASEEPHALLAWLASMDGYSEQVIKLAMDEWSMRSRPGRWSRSQVGVGPVLAAGLLAHIDMSKTRTASALWRFAGLDPTVTWDKGAKRPWNAGLKVLCYKIGESFVKVSGREDAYYGAEYRRRKALYVSRNEAGEYEEYAKARAGKFGRSTEAHKHLTGGKLPPAQVHARARRATVKLFLSHWWQVSWEAEHGGPAPRSWVSEAQPQHHHEPPPGWPCA